VDFSGRTVIGPDPNLRIDEVRFLTSLTSSSNGQVAVPEKVAVKLSYPERVTDYNIALMRQNIINGALLHPGANIVERRFPNGVWGRTTLHMMKKEDLRIKLARELKVGDVVHRHVRDGE
jgi:DNA-directed RNA polymerase III subunit RPC1